MICSSCGANIKEGNSFCTKCGARISVEKVAHPQVQPQVQPQIQPQPQVQPQQQYQQPQYVPQYQQPYPVVYAPVVVQKQKSNVIVFNLIAFITMIVSYFLPIGGASIISSRLSVDISLFDITRAAFEMNRYASYWGVEDNTIYFVIGVIVFFLLAGIVAAFSRGRVISVIVGILMMLMFIPICTAEGFMYAGSTGLAISGLMYFLGGCTGK